MSLDVTIDREGKNKRRESLGAWEIKKVVNPPPLPPLQLLDQIIYLRNMGLDMIFNYSEYLSFTLSVKDV